MMAPRTASMVALTLSLMMLSVRPVRASDTEDVRAVVAREIDAWSKFDAKAVVSLYTSDAIWQNPFGVRLHGTAELAKFLNQLLSDRATGRPKTQFPPRSWTCASQPLASPLFGATNPAQGKSMTLPGSPWLRGIPLPGSAGKGGWRLEYFRVPHHG